MNCKEIKYFLLGCENPDRPPADVKAHLAVCSNCQDWQNRLAMIEMNIPFLPVPESVARAELLRKVLSQPLQVRGEESAAVAALEPPAATEMAAKETAPAILRRIESKEALTPAAAGSSPRRGAGILGFFRAMEPGARQFAAGGIAAAILLVIFGWMVIRTPNHPPIAGPQTTRSNSDPLVASIIHSDLELAHAENVPESFLALAGLADDLSAEAKRLAPLPEAKEVLEGLVKNYQKVVSAGLVEVAKNLPAEGRNDLLNEVGERLRTAGRKVDELGNQLGATIPNSSREALRRLTQAAYDGDEKLRDLRAQDFRQRPVDDRPLAATVLVRKEKP